MYPRCQLDSDGGRLKGKWKVSNTLYTESFLIRLPGGKASLRQTGTPVDETLLCNCVCRRGCPTPPGGEPGGGGGGGGGRTVLLTLLPCEGMKQGWVENHRVHQSRST